MWLIIVCSVITRGFITRGLIITRDLFTWFHYSITRDLARGLSITLIKDIDNSTTYRKNKNRFNVIYEFYSQYYIGIALL